jgi:hypothetical protein
MIAERKSPPEANAKGRLFLVRWAGVEPATKGLKGLCSTTELPAQNWNGKRIPKRKTFVKTAGA